jgi:hypothetical protein
MPETPAPCPATEPVRPGMGWSLFECAGRETVFLRDAGEDRRDEARVSVRFGGAECRMRDVTCPEMFRPSRRSSPTRVGASSLRSATGATCPLSRAGYRIHMSLRGCDERCRASPSPPLRGRVAPASAGVGRGEPGFRTGRDLHEGQRFILHRRSPLPTPFGGHPPPQRGEGGRVGDRDHQTWRGVGSYPMEKRDCRSPSGRGGTRVILEPCRWCRSAMQGPLTGEAPTHLLGGAGRTMGRARPRAGSSPAPMPDR